MASKRFALPNGAYTQWHAEWRINRGRWGLDTGLVRGCLQLLEETNTRSIVELGAGIGHYVAMFRGYGFKSEGFDGIPDIFKLSRGLVRYHDLCEPLPYWQEIPWYDWCLSSEVGEHIPPGHTDAYVKNVVGSCKRGAIISWAHRRQRGSLHVNCRDESEVIELFEAAGLKFDADWTKKMREVVHEKGLKSRISVFMKEKV